MGTGFATKGGKGAAKAMVSKEAWLESLPSDELTGPELELRQALLDWAATSSRRTGKGKGGSAAPLLAEAMQDSRVSKIRAALLPLNVPLQDWVEARIGGEIELLPRQKGHVEVHLRTEMEPEGKDEVQDPRAVLDSLPEDALTEQELELRKQVLQLASKSAPLTVQQVSQHPAVLKAKRAFLPDEIQLREWIDRRIGGEVEVHEDGRVHAHTQESLPAGEANNGLENFFQSLPPESFTNAEEDLRDAIVGFISNCASKDPPALAKVMQDSGVRRCRAEVLPQRSGVSLKDWIERRLGGELEVLQNESGTWTVGILGDSEPTKRQFQASQQWEPPGKVRRFGT